MGEELTKGSDEIYCPECGRTIQRGIAECPFCNVKFRELFALDEPQSFTSQTYSTEQYTGNSGQYFQDPPQVHSFPVKSKAVAVILAIFFGFWSWLYTFRKNAVKFWMTLGIFATLFIITFSYSCSLIIDAANYGEYGADYFGGSYIGFIIFTNIVSFGIWVWSVVDNALKPESFYRDYPRG